MRGMGTERQLTAEEIAEVHACSTCPVYDPVRIDSSPSFYVADGAAGRQSRCSRPRNSFLPNARGLGGVVYSLVERDPGRLRQYPWQQFIYRVQ